MRVHLTNGKQFEKHVRFPKGDPENPLTWQELTNQIPVARDASFSKDSLRRNHQLGEGHESDHHTSRHLEINSALEVVIAAGRLIQVAQPLLAV